LPATRGNHVALIDCGNDKEARVVLEYLRTNHLVVDGLFLTHAHPDHINGCAAIQQEYPQAFIATANAELPALNGKVRHRGLLTKMTGPTDSGLKIDRAFASGAEIVVGRQTVKAIAVPGHTDGSAVYAVNGVLYFGDAATGAADGNVKAPPGPFSDDLPLAVSSLHSLAAQLPALKIDTFAFAHSGPVAADAAKLLAIH
jgi:glyoxylase-like metal-dependent hydrolase (beta-lactamase superfamily II)